MSSMVPKGKCTLEGAFVVLCMGFTGLGTKREGSPWSYHLLGVRVTHLVIVSEQFFNSEYLPEFFAYFVLLEPKKRTMEAQQSYY